MQFLGSPILIAGSMALMIWAWIAVGSFSDILDEMDSIGANYTNTNSTNPDDEHHFSKARVSPP